MTDFDELLKSVEPGAATDTLTREELEALVSSMHRLTKADSERIWTELQEARKRYLERQIARKQ